MHAPYKQKFYKKKYQQISYDTILYGKVAVDCSCEIFMAMLKFSTDHRIKQLFQVNQSLKWLEQEAIKYVYKYLYNYQTHFHHKLDYIFDDNKHITIKQKVRQLRHQNKLECAMKLFSNTDNNIFDHMIKYLQSQISEIGDIIFNYGIKNGLSCIKSTQQYDYDCDIYCAKNYDTIITHDLDIFLFSQSTIINTITDTTIRVLTVHMLMDLIGISDYLEFVKYCVRHGTDYNDPIISNEYDVFHNNNQELLKFFINDR